MDIIVAGGGTVGAQLARVLAASSNNVVVVELDARRASDLVAGGLNVVNGNACVTEPLEAAGALHANVLVACTGADEENLVISVLAKRRLQVPRVVSRVNHDANRWLFNDSWGVDAAVSSASALVSLIEEATGSAHTIRLADLSVAGLVLVEVNITADSPARGLSAAQAPLARSDLVAALVRTGRPMPIDDTIVFQVGDRVLVVTDPDGESRIHAAFHPEDKPPNI